MADQNPQIRLDPTLFSNTAAASPATTNVPLQPVPPVSPTPDHHDTAKPQPLPAAPEAGVEDRRAAVQAELERLQQEENSLLNNIKDWLSKVQGAETRQQILERELFELDRQLSATPSPQQLATERRAKLATYTEQLQQAQAKITEITKLQKIDEKKAFDNYSAGGLDRQGLLEEMEVISQRYADQLAAAKKIATSAQEAITNIDQPANVSTPKAAVAPTHELPSVMAAPTPDIQAMPTPSPEPVSTSTPTAVPLHNNLVTKLAGLPEAATGLLHHLVVELPQQQINPLIERSSDGTGIIIRQDATAAVADRCYIADADLLRAGATPEDIIPLPISTVSSQEATSVTPVV